MWISIYRRRTALDKWVTVWGNATSVAEHRPETYAKDITLRYLVKCAFGGKKLRLHFSNFCGAESVTLSKVTVAKNLTGRQFDKSTLISVTFSGKESVTIEKGCELFSDEIPFEVNTPDTLAVCIYLKDFTNMRSGVVVTGPLSKGFFSVGDCTQTDLLPINETRTLNTYYFLTGVDLFTCADNRCIICYGDSITSQSWPDYLAEKYMSLPKNRTAVVRRAASGTRVLREYTCITYESYGLKGEHRFSREISSVSGAEAVIIQQGINDIIHPVGEDVNPFRPMSDLPSVEELEGGIEEYIATARTHGLKVYVGTLLPIYGWRTYAPFREEMKNSFNEWVRRGKNCIDFEKYLRSEKNPYAFAEGFDSGDHLHPSEDAYKIMAETAFTEIEK